MNRDTFHDDQLAYIRRMEIEDFARRHPESMPPRAENMRRAPNGCIVTPKGVVIGGAYEPPAKDAGVNAEAIQRALLDPAPRAPVPPIGKPLAWRVADFFRRLWR